ncbi:MAG: hypothetical protein GYA62_12915, partial [Bacteroidales bacterium]|nr:hypothetical protein [Bacteroidales bacterium]
MALWNRNNPGDQTLARQLLKELANQSGSRDFLSTTVVGADPFLIAISPQPEDSFRKLAKELLEGKQAMSVVIYIDSKRIKYTDKRFLRIGNKHIIEFKLFDINGNICNSANSMNILIIKNDGTYLIIDNDNTAIDISEYNSSIQNWNICVSSKNNLFTYNYFLNLIFYKFNLLKATEWFDPSDMASPKVRNCKINLEISPVNIINLIKNIDINIYNSNGNLFKTIVITPRKDVNIDAFWTGYADDGIDLASYIGNPYTIIGEIIFLESDELYQSNSLTTNVVREIPLGHEIFPNFKSSKVNKHEWLKVYLPSRLSGLLVIDYQTEFLLYKDLIDIIPHPYTNKTNGYIYILLKDGFNSAIKSMYTQSGNVSNENKPMSVWYWPMMTANPNTRPALWSPDKSLAKYDAIFATKSQIYEYDHYSSGYHWAGYCGGAAIVSLMRKGNNQYEVNDQYKVYFNDMGNDNIEGLFIKLAASNFTVDPNYSFPYNDEIPLISPKPMPNDDILDNYCAKFHINLINNLYYSNYP